MAASRKRSKTGEQKQVVDELARTNQQLEDLARLPQENPNPVLRVDRDGIVLFANAACSRVMDSSKCQPGQLLPDRYRQVVTEVLGTGSHRIIEAKRKGDTFSLDFVPIAGAGYVNIYGSDITERKKAEEELQKARNELEKRVKERTAELLQANARLKEENEERVRTEQSLRLEQARLDALLRLSEMSEVPVDEMAGFVLEHGIALTQSKIGFVGFLSEDESIYTLHAVSKDVVKECNVKGDPVQWHVAKAGIWADAIREHRTLFVNDYSKPHPRKKGLPLGHPPITRLMVVPLFDGKRIVAVAGMGNKASDYDKSDEHQLTLLLRGMWNHVLRNRSREALKEAYDELEQRVEQRTKELATSNAALREEITERKRAEKALKESQNDLNRAQAVAQTGSWRLDVQRNELLWSSETYRIFGIPRGKPMTYETFLSCMHPEDREYVDQKWQAALQGEDYDIEHRIIVGDGIKWVHEKAELEFDKQGMLKGGFGTVHDITERVLSEETIKQAARQWQETFDAIPDLISIHDKDYNILMVNKAFASLFGMTTEQLIGKKCYEVFHRSKGPVLGCPHQQTVKTGQPEREEIFEPTLNAYFDVSTAPVINASVEITGSVHIARDITERKKAEENLRQTRDYLDNLFTYANAPIIVWNPEFKITRFNHAFERLTGRSADEVLGKKVDILIPADERDEALKKISRTTREGERWEIVEVPIQHLNGSVRTVLWNSATLFDTGGKVPLATIAQGQDITELKKTDKLKDEFIGLVSHELRTPLTIITGSLRSAMSQGISAEDARELIQNAAEGADQLAAILENMLELSRHQANRLRLHIEPVRIADVAKAVIERVKGAGAEQRFSVDFPHNLPPVEADPLRVERILYNLVENATKYSPAESEIKVSGRRERDFVITEVTDQGQGIPRNEQDKLFGLFERVEEGRHPTRGLGLGLVVCKRLVEAQGGWIEVDSEPGKGSTFTFALPIRGAKA